MERMVSKRKKSAKQVQGTTEKVTEATETPKIDENDEESTKTPKWAPDDEQIKSFEDIAKESKTPKASFIDETPKLLQLLNDAPKVPLLTNMRDTTQFIDDYRRWKERVKAETS